MLASLLIPPLYNIGTTSVKSVLFQGAHTKDIKNPRKLFTNAEDYFKLGDQARLLINLYELELRTTLRTSEMGGRRKKQVAYLYL